jgi:hypothetical protein
MEIAVRMNSCPQRDVVRARTLESWAGCDWGSPPAIELDDGRHSDVVLRISETWRKMLGKAAGDTAEFCLFLEDDIKPNRFLRHNLERWPLLRSIDGRRPFFASLYWSNQPLLWRNEGARYLVGAPEAAWGSQALLLSRTTIHYLVDHWDQCREQHQDIRMARLAAQISPIYYHTPSLVQHSEGLSTWGNGAHRASDFDPLWSAP